jgi:hypothetical protein
MLRARVSGCPYRKLDPHVVMVENNEHWPFFDTPVAPNGRPYRKLNPDVPVVQSAQNEHRTYAAKSLGGARSRRVLVQ